LSDHSAEQDGVGSPSSGARIASHRPTPHRLVISIALVLFVPDLWLVIHENLAVQTALVRFIGALGVSWIAARLVFATLNSFPSSPLPGDTKNAPGTPRSPGRVGDIGLGAADPAGWPDDTNSKSLT
jgi:hypothetical protein